MHSHTLKYVPLTWQKLLLLLFSSTLTVLWIVCDIMSISGVCDILSSDDLPCLSSCWEVPPRVSIAFALWAALISLTGWCRLEKIMSARLLPIFVLIFAIRIVAPTSRYDSEQNALHELTIKHHPTDFSYDCIEGFLLGMCFKKFDLLRTRQWSSDYIVNAKADRWRYGLYETDEQEEHIGFGESRNSYSLTGRTVEADKCGDWIPRQSFNFCRVVLLNCRAITGT